MCHIQVLLYYPCRRSWDSKFMFKFVSIVTLNDIIHLKYLKINIQFEYHSNGELRLNWRTYKTNFRGHDMFLEGSLKTKLMFWNTKYTTFECMETKLTLKYNHYLIRSKIVWVRFKLSCIPEHTSLLKIPALSQSVFIHWF